MISTTSGAGIDLKTAKYRAMEIKDFEKSIFFQEDGIGIAPGAIEGEGEYEDPAFLPAVGDRVINEEGNEQECREAEGSV